ncbi:MAG: tRNA (adenosine(37)-N6)-threonylcarbamoyltransferase complex dimerization subunit type 1 TsaB, partial [Sandarakinorhabdus sp.]|nr:tRNA (adenosine(37)-N6)-threonylcarbamoyltransferase complex dimerization subunit type 1 TsaB [Sandarakinorhabdus sp.]
IGRGHAEALMPAIAAMMGDRRAGAILVDIGPGSFTGIRICTAAARAPGLAWGVPVAGFEGGALVAAQAFADRCGLAGVTVLLDAGRAQLLRQQVARDFSAGPIDTVAPAELAIGAEESTAGAMAPASPGLRIHDCHPDARFALAIAPQRRALPPQALYVRPPDAVLPL